MIPLIIAGLILIIIWTFLYFMDDLNIPSILIAFIPAFIVLTMFWVLGTMPIYIDDGTKDIDIVQLKIRDNTGISGGGSFLGWSVSGNKPEYVVMHNVDGRMKRKFLSQADTYIVETDEQPRVEYYQYIKTYSKRWAAPWLWDDKTIIHRDRHATICVPKGTVILKYNKI